MAWFRCSWGRAKGHHHSRLCGAVCHQHLSWYCCPDCHPPQPLAGRNREEWRKTSMLLSKTWNFQSCFTVWIPVSPSSSGKYLLSMASLIWLFAPLGSRSIAQLKFIKAKWVWPNFLYTWRVDAVRHRLVRQRPGGITHLIMIMNCSRWDSWPNQRGNQDKNNY